MNKQLVLNEKFKQHMEAHKEELNKNFIYYLTDDVKKELLKNCKWEFNIINITYNEVVGECNIVVTTEKDDIFWAKRKGRNIYSRFVRNRVAESTNIMTFIIKEQKNNKGYFNIISMYPSNGTSFKEIFDKNLDENEGFESFNYWSNHAFVGEYEVGTDKDIFELGGNLINKEFYESKNYKICGGDYIKFEETEDDKVILMYTNKINTFSLFYCANVIGYNTDYFTNDYTDVECNYTKIKIRRAVNNYCFQDSLIS